MNSKEHEFRGQGNEKLRILQSGRDWPKLQEWLPDKEVWVAAEVHTFQNAIFEELCRVLDLNPKWPHS